MLFYFAGRVVSIDMVCRESKIEKKTSKKTFFLLFLALLAKFIYS